MAGKAGNSDYDTLGRVTLVGAGPGAADLITVRGQNILREADVVVYDDLANADLLEICRPGTIKIYVGKRAGRHCVPQQEIGEILIREASQGRHVVRLKGGDPLVFGRAGEEARALAEAGVPFEIVPGVTAASAAAAVAGVSLTQRGLASAVVFVTGHECRGKSQEAAVDWRALAQTRATLCIYMGVRRFAGIAGELCEGGLAADTPVAMVANATLPTQAVTFGTLGDAPALMQSAAGQPGLIIVGEVVRLADILAEARTRLETLPA